MAHHQANAMSFSSLPFNVSQWPHAFTTCLANLASRASDRIQDLSQVGGKVLTHLNNNKIGYIGLGLGGAALTVSLLHYWLGSKDQKPAPTPKRHKYASLQEQINQLKKQQEETNNWHQLADVDKVKERFIAFGTLINKIETMQKQVTTAQTELGQRTAQNQKVLDEASSTMQELNKKIQILNQKIQILTDPTPRRKSRIDLKGTKHRYRSSSVDRNRGSVDQH